MWSILHLAICTCRTDAHSELERMVMQVLPLCWADCLASVNHTAVPRVIETTRAPGDASKRKMHSRASFAGQNWRSAWHSVNHGRRRRGTRVLAGDDPGNRPANADLLGELPSRFDFRELWHEVAQFDACKKWSTPKQRSRLLPSKRRRPSIWLNYRWLQGAMSMHGT